MAAEKTPDQEPTIEEILASIRQIISDDDGDNEAPVAEEKPVVAEPKPKPAPVTPPPPVVETAVEEPEDDVLELTELADDEEVEVYNIALQDLPEEEPEEAVEEVVTMEEPTPVFTQAPKEAAPATDILTEVARASTISSMAKLAGNMPITRNREYGNITLEDLVREMLHPMLKDWLSDNLPPMVERMVQKELEKLARQAQDV